MRRLAFVLVASLLCFLPKRTWLEIGERALHTAGGFTFQTAARVAWLGGTLYPESAAKREWLLFGELCDACAYQMFARALSIRTVHPLIPPSHSSWHRYQELLAKIPAETESDARLLSFLRKRWLAKANGFYTSEVEWLCPSFGYSVQVHPETTNSYARDPSTKSSLTYLNQVNEWKKRLPQPESFPLVLTRPFSLENYLPPHLEVPANEAMPETIERLASLVGAASSRVVVDLSQALQASDSRTWLELWDDYKDSFAQQCQAAGIPLERVVCVQSLESDDIGGLRILPISQKEADPASRFLCAWVSHLGLSANPLEVDRFVGSLDAAPPFFGGARSCAKGELAMILENFNSAWRSGRPERELMVRGALEAMRGLVESITEEQWSAALYSSTRSEIVRLSISEIEEELRWLVEQEENSLFFDMVAHVEQIFSHFVALLEIFSPFSQGDFASIYQQRLSCIPPSLKSLTGCALHASAMTSVGGILHASRLAAGKTPRVLYGDNTYFECIMVAKELGIASPTTGASLEDLQDADLIFAKFNPVLIRGDDFIEGYRVERIEETLRSALGKSRTKPLTLALDSTIDAIDSTRTKNLLEAFQNEILSGALCIVCFRSGLKFDLFGMDNYAGAPFYAIHSREPKWAPFNALTKDPVLQTDRLSANWFCLAYRYAAPYLEQYRAQIFENTRQVLDRAPQRLFAKDSAYRITPVEKGADAAFIDLRVTGPLHPLRCSAFVGATTYLDCMKGGHPIFYRRSIGFYHPNFGVLFGEENSSARITVGLDPSQIDLLVETCKKIDALNQSF